VQCLAKEMSAKLYSSIFRSSHCERRDMLFILQPFLDFFPGLLHPCSYSQAFLWFSHKVPSVDTSTPVLHLLEIELGKKFLMLCRRKG